MLIRYATNRKRRLSALPNVGPYSYLLACLLAHSLTPWSRVLRSYPFFVASQKIPRILWNPKFLYGTHKCPPPVPILSNLHPVPPKPSNFLKSHLHIYLPFTSGFSNGLFPHQHTVHFPLLQHSRHMPRPSHSRFYHPHNIG
jgi:hypothetical protein